MRRALAALALPLAACACGRTRAAPAAPAEPSSAPALPSAGAPPRAAPVAPRLCFTLGAARPAPEGRFSIDDAKTRAFADGADGDRAELRFRYVGPTAETSALGSGAVRRQLGLKLRAENGCNLIYAMWRFEPKNEIVVSVKRNVGMQTHAECKNGGYRNVKAAVGAAPPKVSPGEEHTVAAEIVDGELRVRADGVLAWRGALPDDALALRGPPGLRTDNVRVEAAFVPSLPAEACQGEREELDE